MTSRDVRMGLAGTKRIYIGLLISVRRLAQEQLLIKNMLNSVKTAVKDNLYSIRSSASRAEYPQAGA
jgi:hypothetical protein